MIRRRRGGWRGVAVAAGVVLASVAAPAVLASHTDVVAYDLTMSAFSGSYPNGYRIYLSSPRHKNSGGRGELGWEENINGRHFNMYAANGNYYAEQYEPTSSLRNFRARGYDVTVSANERDNGYLTNRTASDNWGADVHIVTHTNAGQGNYTLTMWKCGADSTGKVLANSIRDKLDVKVPGGQNSWCGNWDELSAQAAQRVYVEVFFHDNQAHVDWFEGGGGAGDGVKSAWRYGWAVDGFLGYP